jgi:hypothetical protein
MGRIGFGILVAALILRSEGAEPFQAVSGVARGPHFVGETIDVVVRISSAEGRPSIVAPWVRGAVLRAAGTDVQPISSSAIGDIVHELNRYVYRYRLTVDTAGKFTLPPFLLRQGGRSSRTAPLLLTIRPIPANRPGTFLGGVGPIRVEVEAVPASITLGERLEYRVTLSGPGSQGVRQPPTLERLKRLPIEPTVTLISNERVDSPPKRLIRYRLRPAKPGEATLPPLAISTFDPRSQRFLVALSESVPIRVNVPSLGAILSEQPASSPSPPWWRRGSVRGISALMLVSIVGLTIGIAVRRRARRFHPGRWSRSQARRFQEALDTHDLPREITERLADFLHLANVRPKGALTPAEAREGIERLGGSAGVAEEAERLIRACDATRFAGGTGDNDDSEAFLGQRASRFFTSLAGDLSARKHRERHSRPPR